MSPASSYQLKVQAQGRVVLPSAVRADLQVEEGDEVILLKTESGYQVTSRALLAQSLLGILKPSTARDYTQELLDERRTEVEQRGW